MLKIIFTYILMIGTIYGNYNSVFENGRNTKINLDKSGISGAVSGVWDADTIQVSGDIFIPKDSTLTIMPGTNVYFSGEYKFNVYGTLVAEGTETEQISFFSDSLEQINVYPYYKGFWGGINFLSNAINAQEISRLKYCNIKYGFETWIDELMNRIGGGLVLYKSTVMLENVSVEKCVGAKGGGIHLFESEINIKNSLFSNLSENGIYAENSSINIAGSRVSKSAGAGIYCLNSSINIDDCLLDSNSNTYGNGSGLYANNTTVFIEDTEISHNTSGNSQGGGLTVISSPSVSLLRVKILHNYSSSEGGGVSIVGTPAYFKNVEVAYNSADYTGGGINFSNDGNGQTPRTAFLKNCLIYKNESRSTNGIGAGLELGMNVTVNIINTTITDNSAKDFAAISNTWGTGIANVMNSIIYNNGLNYDLQVQGDNSKYNYSLIQGYYSGMDTTITNLNNYNPSFINSDADNFKLQNIACGGFTNSPAIDTGNPLLADFVLDCEAGLGGERSDMGAYGGEANRWLLSMMPECHYIDAVSGVWDCDEIVIEGDIFIPANDTLIIEPGVKVRFSGNYKLDVFGVLIAVGTNTDSITFTGREDIGWGGIRFNNLDSTNTEESTFQYCKFENGNLTNDFNEVKNGGALSIIASSKIKIENNYFANCKAYLGGAVYVRNASPTIKYNKFENNMATGAGGGMYLDNFNSNLHRLDFVGNTANNGGAIFLNYSSPQMTNILAYNNESAYSGGFAFLFNSSPNIVSLTSTKNISHNNSGGSFSLMYVSHLTLLNSILYNNSPVDIYINEGTVTAEYSILMGGSTQPYFGEGCLDVDPQFRSVDNNDYHLEYLVTDNNSISPAVDAGKDDPLYNDTYLDYNAGLGTVRGDMGCYGGKFYSETSDVQENDINTVPTEFSLKQNYPNPFNPSTTISFSLPIKSEVTLKIYDALGKEIAVLINEELQAGSYQKQWSAGNLASGVYFYRLLAGNYTETKKLILMK